MKEKLHVEKMTCSHCENRVDTALLALDGVSKCKANAKKQEVILVYDENIVALDKIKETIKEEGYEVI